MDDNIEPADGEVMVRTARHVVEEHLRGRQIAPDAAFESKFSFRSGVFVTLSRRKSLRGCIGRPYPEQSLSSALLDAAVCAATEDPRFDPVGLDELDEITFEVTVLTAPQKISVDKPEEYPSRIKVGRDGLIVRHVLGSGLLLPQVPVEYGWHAREFLEYTCEKAGLGRESWMGRDIEILAFQAIIFKEEEPRGTVTRVSL